MPQPPGPPPPPPQPLLQPELFPRCISCGYALHGLTEPRCPECGRHFDPHDARTYTLLPPFIRWRYWMPGLLLALGGGLIAYAIAVAASGFGWATTIVLPMCAGALLGYGARVKWFMLVLLALILTAALVTGLITMQLAGIYCGLILGGIALGPLLIGTLAGWILRTILKQSRFAQRWHLPTICLLALPMALAWVDRVTRIPAPAETVATTAVIAVPPDDAWPRVRFYEQVGAGGRFEEPAIFRWSWLGLPRPLYSAGSSARPGDRTICVYDKGRLVKQTTAVESHQTDAGVRRVMAFRVVEQEFERNAVRLLGGRFIFESIDAGHTRVTLETTYLPRLGPRWCWRPSERWTVGQLHGHVLRGLSFEPVAPPARAEAGR